VILDCPGRRLSSSAWISSFEIRSLGGTPSITQPTPLPCDSPKVVTRKAVPQVLAAPARVSTGAERRRWWWLRRGAGAAKEETREDEDAVVVVVGIAVDGLIALFSIFDAKKLALIRWLSSAAIRARSKLDAARREEGETS
jgi:hypothetical protein